MNLNLEGTKHEKVVLVILAYVIGFTTGLICFGLSVNHDKYEVSEHGVEMSDTISHETMVNPDDNYPEQITPESEQQTAPEETSTSTNSEVSVGYEGGRLFSNLNGASVVLSVKRDQLTPDQVQVFSEQGLHDAIPNYLVSQDSNYIYFCEQKTEADSCSDLIYDVENKSIHFVTIDGVKVASTAVEAKTANWNGSLLSIGNKVSQNASEPWKLAQVN